MSKTQLFIIYMKQSQDVYLLYNCVYYIHVTVILTRFLASIALFFNFFHQDNSCIGFLILQYIENDSSSSFYTVYCQRYSDFKTFGERWQPC